MDSFYIFVGLGTIFGLFYSIWGNDIFDYNADPGQEKAVEQKKRNFKKAPKAWKVEHFIHRFIGVLLGWTLLWVLLDLRMQLFSGKVEINNLGFIDLILFLLSFVGINGRLPTIAHSIEKWFSWPSK